jgi:HSP20 family protein
LFGDFPDRLRGNTWQPALDVFETADSVVVRAEIPGVRGEDLRVNVDGEVVRISGVRMVPADPAVRRLHQMEIAFGPFEREVRIQIAFDRDQVTANLEDGFLLVTLPKHVAVSRQVAVETE